MSRRWHWDFEAVPGHERTPKPALPPAPPEPPPQPLRAPSAAHARGRYRRRRVAAALVLLALIALLFAAVEGSGARHSASSGLAGGAPRPVKGAHATPESEAKAVSSVLAYTPFLRAGGERAREIALTFDDGPGPYTPQVLSVLEREHVRATFFVIGRMLRYFGASVQREVSDGDVIGDHTETHPMLAALSPHDQYEQLFEQIVRAELVGASRPQLFRPPYGSFDATTLRDLHNLHLLMVLWSVDTSDYKQPGVPAIVQAALEGARPGAIMLLHDAGGTRTETIEALPQIIHGLRKRGYRLVTVPELLRDDPPPAGQPVPTSLAGD